MAAPIVNPEIPYVGAIPGNIELGKMCRIQGVTHPNTDRFNINFQTGPNSKPRDDTALHISVRLNQGYIARNSYANGEWGDEDGNGRLPIGAAQAFEILILAESSSYKIAVNGQHLCDFPYRIPYKNVSNLLIDGDVSITLISWEAITTSPLINEVANQTSQSKIEGSQIPPGQYGPPQGYGPGPGYGPPPPQYGPQDAYGYGPPVPPGAQPESGFDSFLEQAQSVLAGAIKSGAAEKLLGGLLSTGNQQPAQGQGYAPQNAQYGQYPQQYQQQQQQQQQEQKGPLENLLSGLLSGGSNQQQQNQPPQPHIPQVGGQGSVGGLGSMGGLLSDFAGQFLHNPKQGN